MRDPKRIRRICNKFANLWESCPDLRFWQLIDSLAFDTKNELRQKDLFYTEDNIAEAIIDKVTKNIENGCGL